MSTRWFRATVIVAWLAGCGGSAPAACCSSAAPSSPVASREPAPSPSPEPSPESPPEPAPASVEEDAPADPPAPPMAIWDPDAPVQLPPEVEAHVRAVARRVPNRNADVFAKIGDSATASRTFMRCLGEDDELELAGRDELRPAIERIRRARVAGRSSFTRESEAAVVGRSVHTLLRGRPSPVDREVHALSPRFALVMFGGNDVEIGRLDLFATSMLRLVDRLLARGVIPIVSTTPPRSDDAASNAQVPRYNAVTEAVARARRLPLIDLHRAMSSLPGHGLASDGVHPNAPVRDGRAHACDFGEAGLAFGMNVRNLLNLRMLSHLGEVLAASGEASEPPPPAPETRIRGPRFATVASTVGGARALDRYPGCDETTDESGPERRYALEVQHRSTVRAEVMYASPVDVDIHLLSGGRCVARGDRHLEAVVEPGEYELLVDTFESDRHAGEYLLLVEHQAS